MGLTVSRTLVGFSLENLDPEKLSFSLTALLLGRSRTEALESLVSEVWKPRWPFQGMVLGKRAQAVLLQGGSRALKQGQGVSCCLLSIQMSRCLSASYRVRNVTITQLRYGTQLPFSKALQ